MLEQQPRQRQTQDTEGIGWRRKEVSKSIFNTNHLGKQLQKVIRQQDEDDISVSWNKPQGKM
jgi:hypothetical protein